MKLILKLNLLLLFTLITSSLYAQTANKAVMAKETEKIYYYSFSGNIPSENIEMMKEEILRMQFKTLKGLG